MTEEELNELLCKPWITVYRYMSQKEFNLLMKGETLFSNNKTCEKYGTTSKGFCFLPERIRFVSVDGTPHEFSAVDCYEFLRGIVSDEVLVEFKTTPASSLKVGISNYHDPFGGYNDVFFTYEYSTMSYSKHTISPQRVWFSDEMISFDDFIPIWQDL